MSDDRFLWQGSPTPEPAPQPSPVRRGGRRRALPLGMLAVVGVVAAVLAFALPGGGASNSVAQAASVTAAQPGYRYTMNILVTVGGVTQQLSATGAVSENPQPVMSMQMTVGGTPYKAVIASPWEYVDLHSAWFKLNLNAVVQAVGGPGISPTSTDPSQILHYLEGTGTVTRIGTETVGDVMTTHYHALSNIASAAATFPPAQRAAATKALTTLQTQLGVASIPMDVWVDGQGRVRQTVMALDGICSQRGTVDENVTMTFDDFGPQVAAAVPSGAIDLTSIVASQVAKQRRQTFCAG